MKAAIIGCGAIGTFLDNPKSTTIATHAHAFTAHPKTELAFLCDIDRNKADKARLLWNPAAEIYDDYRLMLDNESIDIVAIAADTPHHYDILHAVLTSRVGMIICEKPLVATLQEFEAIRPLLESSGKKIVLNYIRRYDPSFIKLHTAIATGRLGNLLTFQGIVSRGLYHNGSHMLELLDGWFDLQNVSSTAHHIIDNDQYGSFTIHCHDGIGTLNVIEQKEYAVFELDLFFERGAVKITNSGHTIHLYSAKKSRAFKGYSYLAPSKTLEGTLSRYQFCVLDFLIRTPQKKTAQILTRHLEFSRKLLRIKEHSFCSDYEPTF